MGTGDPVLDTADPALVALRHAGFGRTVLDLFDWAGSVPIWAALVGALTLVAAWLSRRLAIQLLIAAVAGEVASALIKVVVGRTRPEGADITELLISASFPSGHVTRVAVLAAALLLLAPRGVARGLVAIVGACVVLTMGLARVSARAHHMSDVIAAMFLAALIVGVWAMYRQRRPNVRRTVR